MIRLILPFLLWSILAPLVSAQSTVFIARHAEKAEADAADPKNPDLSDVGRARAESLGKMLRDAGLTAVFSTEFKRTQQTALPAAHAAHIDVTTVPASDTNALLAQLRETKGNALVIGHSNTIPAIIKALGVETPIAVADNDYDNLFIVIPGAEPRLLRLHY
jgi:broad specificity phosphatase PhoE